ncbi:MAG: 4-hydroxy-tetrahydrodipicolinate synthase [Campylobacterota bacterium]|nr:4-hydroxy-tetrahydrodipicolinate synthase [Campylobacterota bacterium]
MQQITGSTTAIITPFKNGKLDEQTYAKLIKRQIENGIDAVCPVGTTGESCTLQFDEDVRCIEIAVEVCKGTDTKVLAGAGSNATHEAIRIAKQAQKLGVDAIFSVSPYYNKPSQEGLYQHYRSICDAVPELGVMLYSVPGRTGIDINSSTVKRLFDDCTNMYGIKEASANLDKIVELHKMIPELKILSGDDGTDYPSLVSGAAGITSVTSNLLPDLKAKLTSLALEGNFEEARKIHEDLYEINNILFCESNPIPIKAAMYIAGLTDTLEYRLPLTAPSNENMKKIEAVIQNYNIVK